MKQALRGTNLVRRRRWKRSANTSIWLEPAGVAMSAARRAATVRAQLSIVRPSAGCSMEVDGYGWEEEHCGLLQALGLTLE